MSGFFITRRRVGTQINETLGITLMSDLHVDSAHTDLPTIKKELDLAREHGDRILINGDVFDGILPSDRKRYSPVAMREELRGRADILNASLDLASDLLGPYVDLIDMIGIGNHEASIEKHHSVDLGMMLVDRLNGLGKGVVNYGGYTGFVEYTAPLSGSSRRLVLYYHHGGGGSAPVTKGIIDFSRMAMYVDSDVTWVGHRHNRITDTGNCRLSLPVKGSEPQVSQQVAIMTGGYMDHHKGQTQAEMKRKGRMASYASDWGLAPQWKGGARLLVSWDRNRDRTIRVVS